MTELLPSLLILSILCYSVEAESVQVSPNCPANNSSCLDIDAALADLSNGITLILASGNHLIKENHFNDTHGVSNITIVGSSLQETTINCGNGSGLTFIGVRDLVLLNFTIANCGLTDADLLSSVSLLKEVIDLFFLVPPTARVALFLGNCVDVLMQDIHITNTTGLGLLGINVIGNSMLDRVSFTRNIRPRCTDTEPILPSLITPDIHDQVGGGAYFLYTEYYNKSEPVDDVKMVLQNTYFAYNADCTHASTIIINYQHYTDDASHGLYEYAIGAGGGLSVILSNSNFAVDVTVVDSTFYRNDARYGGGAYVATFSGFETSVNVSFVRCMFRENGMAGSGEILPETYSRGGAGLAIFADLIKPEHFSKPIPSFHSTRIQTMVTGSVFIENRAAFQGGGVMAYSLFNTPHSTLDSNDVSNYYAIRWIFRNSTFSRNSARYSSAAYFTQLSSHSLAGSVGLQLFDLNVTENYDRDVFPNIDEHASAFHLKSVACVAGNVVFVDNLGSALRLESSVMVVHSLDFRNNTARRGGGVYVSGQISAFSLVPFSHLNFTENHAILEGGAIYLSPPPIPYEILQPVNFFECIIATPAFSTSENPDGNFGLFDENIKISFERNSAPLGGMVFGSSLENCPWAQNIVDTDGFSLYQTLHKDYSSLFYFDVEPVGQGMVSSVPSDLNVSLPSGESIELFPGQTTNIGIEVFDLYNATIPAVVRAVVEDPEGIAATPILGESGFWHTSVPESELRIVGDYTGDLNVSILTQANSLSESFLVTMVPCPIGFSINSETMRCTCDERLLAIDGLECNSDTVTFTTFENTFVGLRPDDSIENSTAGDLVVDFCILDYCETNMGNNTIDPPGNFNSQCGIQRVGFLCGKCAANYSNVFGTNQCLKCSNYWLFLIPAFAVAGTFLFAGIALLEITVDKGLTNAALFHANIFSLFFHVLPYKFFLALLFLPGKLLTLQIGINTCFYNGMTALERSFILFLFPIYLFLLILIFAFLCKRYTWLSVHFSPAKTLATLTHLCYLNTLTSTLDIILPVVVRSVDGQYTPFWLLDPTQKYFSGYHGVLGTLGLILIVGYLIPFPLLLLLPATSYKYFKKWSPIFDVLFASYKLKLRFWAGIRVIMVAIMILTSRIPNVFAFLIVGVLMLIFVSIQTVLKPFRDQWANYMDTLLINVVILYYWGVQAVSEIEYTTILTDMYVAALVLIAYCVYIAAFILHLHRHFPKLGLLFLKKMSFKKKCQVVITETVLALDDIADQRDDDDEHPNCRVPQRTLTPSRYPGRMLGTPQYRDSILSSNNFEN